MEWKILCNVKPPEGVKCLVGRKVNHKSSYGIYTYVDSSKPYWKDKYGSCTDTYIYDHWCSVDDIISAVESRLEDDIKVAIDILKMRNGTYYR